MKNVADSRNDELEEALAGCPIVGHETEIPCLSEGGCFMSADTYSKMTVHPYKKGNSGTHGHFLETELVYPPFTLPAKPFGWTMLRKGNDRDDANIARLLDSENDKRRIRAYTISQLEKQALWGHTVYPLDKIIEEVNELPIEPECRVISGVEQVENFIKAPEMPYLQGFSAIFTTQIFVSKMWS